MSQWMTTDDRDGKPLSLAAVGDLIMADAHDDRNPIYDVINGADIASANLEMVLTRRQEAGDKMIALRAEPELAHRIAAMGFGVLCLANNHSMDFAAPGLLDSIDAVKDASMAPVGAGSTLEASLVPHVAVVRGRRIAFFGVSTTLPNGSAAGAARPGIAPVRVLNRFAIDPVTMEEAPGMSPFVETEAVGEDVERLCAAIRTYSEQVDLVVVNIHWGIPLGWVAASQDEIAQYQQPLARAMIDAGASAIIGHHPHVVQAIEFYRNAPIFYSLGHFIMHDILPASDASLAAHPPYDWNTLRTVWNGIGCIARISWNGPSDAPHCELVVTELDERGESRIGSRASAELLRQRLAPQCSRRGAEIMLNQDGDLWTLQFAPANPD